MSEPNASPLHPNSPTPSSPPTSSPPPSSRPLDIPTAETRRKPFFNWLWLIPLAALGVSGWLLYQSFAQKGIEVRIRFPEGHGLKVDDTIRYRGIIVGTVDQIDLSDSLAHVIVKARLEPTAKAIAVQGSRFWIVRPQLALEGARGLETVVGAKYISVIPGEVDRPAQRTFAGLADPPQQANQASGSLLVTTTSVNAAGLRPGAPVTYRQVQIGTVTRMGLSKNASRVEAELTIQPEYTRLIRTNTKFWKVSGVSISAGILSGIEFDLDSLSSLLLGGIAIATPPAMGEEARTGDPFILAAEPEEEWLGWESTVDLGMPANGRATDLERPVPIPTRMNFIEPRLLFDAARERRGFVTPVGDELIGPNTLLVLPADARDPVIRVDLGFTNLVLESAELMPGRIARKPLPAELETPAGWSPWPAAKTRVPDSGTPEDVRILHPDVEADCPLVTTSQLRAVDKGWAIRESVYIEPTLHGVPVVGVRDNKMIGVLFINSDGASVALLSE